jgi:hypothetical protein
LCKNIVSDFFSYTIQYGKGCTQSIENQEALMNKISIMEASVRKWQRIIDGKSSDGGVLDCPPCRIYYMLICFGCPIAEYTGKKF